MMTCIVSVIHLFLFLNKYCIIIFEIIEIGINRNLPCSYIYVYYRRETRRVCLKNLKLTRLMG